MIQVSYRSFSFDRVLSRYDCCSASRPAASDCGLEGTGDPGMPLLSVAFVAVLTDNLVDGVLFVLARLAALHNGRSLVSALSWTFIGFEKVMNAWAFYTFRYAAV